MGFMKTARKAVIGTMATFFTIAGTGVAANAQNNNFNGIDQTEKLQKAGVEAYNIKETIIRYNSERAEVTDMKVVGWAKSAPEETTGIKTMVMHLATDKNRAMDMNGNNNALFIDVMNVTSKNVQQNIGGQSRVGVVNKADLDFSIKTSVYNSSKNREAFVIVPEPSQNSGADYNFPKTIDEMRFVGSTNNFVILDDNTGQPFPNQVAAANKLKDAARVYGLLLTEDSRKTYGTQLVEFDANSKNKLSTYKADVLPANAPLATPRNRRN